MAHSTIVSNKSQGWALPPQGHGPRIIPHDSWTKRTLAVPDDSAPWALTYGDTNVSYAQGILGPWLVHLSRLLENVDKGPHWPQNRGVAARRLPMCGRRRVHNIDARDMGLAYKNPPRHDHVPAPPPLGSATGPSASNPWATSERADTRIAYTTASSGRAHAQADHAQAPRLPLCPSFRLGFQHSSIHGPGPLVSRSLRSLAPGGLLDRAPLRPRGG